MSSSRAADVDSHTNLALNSNEKNTKPKWTSLNVSAVSGSPAESHLLELLVWSMRDIDVHYKASAGATRLTKQTLFLEILLPKQEHRQKLESDEKTFFADVTVQATHAQ